MAYKDRERQRQFHRERNAKRRASKPFVFIDGEGDDGENYGRRQRYMLMGASTGQRLQAEDLNTYQIFRWLIDLAEAQRYSWFVMYGMSYDVEMWLRNVPPSTLRKLMAANKCYVGSYIVSYYPGKIFELTDRERHTKITIYDVRGFWSATHPSHVVSSQGVSADLGGFIAALDKELGTSYADRQLIIDGKLDRGYFAWEDVADVERYMSAELERGVDLMESLRGKTNRLGWDLKSWHGSGAIANHILASHGVEQWTPEHGCGVNPSMLWAACVGSYYGGWIDQGFIGWTDRTVYQMDQNSAYPYAMLFLPPMQGGYWRRYRGGRPVDHAMYYIRWEAPRSFVNGPHPFSFRQRDGSVIRPPIGEGWVHGIELTTVLYSHIPYRIDIQEGFEFVPADASARAFGWVQELYDMRAEMKAAGDPAEMVLKPGYATLYGKEAQQTGAMKYQNLFHAGEITARTRAGLWKIAMQNPGAWISSMTDSLYSLEPYDADMGLDLGQWKDEGKIIESVWCQAGVAFGRLEDDPEHWTKQTARGFGTKLKLDAVLAHMADLRDETRPVTSYKTFVTMRRAEQLGDWDRWRRWEDLTRTLDLRQPQGKRYHVPALCEACRAQVPMNRGLHAMMPVGRPTDQPASHIRRDSIERLAWLDAALEEEVIE